MPPLCSCPPGASTGTHPNAWDYGIWWRNVLVTKATEQVLEVGYVREKVLRVVNDSVEDGHIGRLIDTAAHFAELEMDGALKPQTHQMLLSGFPSGFIKLPKAPVISVTSFDYTDGDGNSQSLAVSPLGFQLVPAGEQVKALLLPLPGESWPSSTQSGLQAAVTITYVAGFSDDEHPRYMGAVEGVSLMVNEMYKNRSLSVVGTSVSQATLKLEWLWRKWY